MFHAFSAGVKLRVQRQDGEWIEIRNPVSERIAHSGDWRIYPHLSNKDWMRWMTMARGPCRKKPGLFWGGQSSIHTE